MNITLLGVPNSGKTSLFNKLTNKRLKTGNFAGVTVDAAEGILKIQNQDFIVTDLPGVNSLSYFSDSKDEIVVSKYIQDNPNDLYINVINIGQIKRHLLLTINALSKGLNLIVAVNMVDTANITPQELKKIKTTLEDKLKVPVVLISARKNMGIDELKKIIADKSQNTVTDNKSNKKDTLFQEDLVQNNRFISEILDKLPKINIKSNIVTHYLDKLFLNKILAIPLFLLSIYIVLLITMNIHSIFSDFIENIAGIYLVGGIRSILEFFNVNEFFIILFSDGLGGGAQVILTFLPIIFTLFFLLGVLEESGYTARQAFIADGVMQKIGLPGKAFVSLTLGLGCTAACASGCRTLERESDRRLSLMISPSISCSAKLPVYIYFCYIIFADNAVNMVFLMYLIGILFSIVNGIFLSKSLFNSKPLPFIIELPDYRIPSFSNIFVVAIKRAKNFLVSVGKVVIPIVMVITLLGSITYKGNLTEYNSNDSIIAVVSKKITPILHPIGITDDNWEATLSLITGFLAKETVIATLNTVYFSLSEEKEENGNIIEDTKQVFADLFDSIVNHNVLDLFGIEDSIADIEDNQESKRVLLQNKFHGTIGIFSFLLFFLLYTPCVAAMGSIAKELGKTWSFGIGFWSLFNAYAISFSYYQLATNFSRGCFMVMGVIAVYTSIFILFRYLHKKYFKQWDSNFIFTQKTPN